MRKEKQRTKYLLEFLTEELYAQAVHAQIEMFKPTMVVKDDILGGDVRERIRKRLHVVSKDSFNAAKKESKYIIELRGRLDKLHAFHLRRRLIVFDKFKEVCLNAEFNEEEEFIAKYCKNIDVNLISKHFKTKNRTCIEFKFNDDFFNEMVGLSLIDEEQQRVDDEKYIEDYRLNTAFNKLSHENRIKVINQVECMIKNHEDKHEKNENEAQGANVDPEKVELKEKSEKVAEKADLPLLAASEAQQEEIKVQEEKKETSVEEKETSRKKAERFLQEVIS